MKIVTYLLAVIAGSFLVATPSNIATDVVMQGYAGVASTACYCIGLMALLGLGYCVGISTERDNQEQIKAKEERRKAK